MRQELVLEMTVTVDNYKDNITDSKKAHIFRYEPSLIWQGWRDSNSQHARSYGGGNPLIFSKLQIAKRPIPFGMGLL